MCTLSKAGAHAACTDIDADAAADADADADAAAAAAAADAVPAVAADAAAAAAAAANTATTMATHYSTSTTMSNTRLLQLSLLYSQFAYDSMIRHFRHCSKYHALSLSAALETVLQHCHERCPLQLIHA